MLRPTREQRRLVSRPLGELIPRPKRLVPSILRKRFLAAGHRISFSVGDAVTSTLLGAGIPFEVAVVDGRVRRKSRELPPSEGRKVFRVRNPRGHLSLRARQAMKEALAVGGGSVVAVDGEEDLLTLFAIDLSPEGDLVVYGQPGEGLVVVRADRRAKQKNSKLLDSMPRVRAESN